MYLGHPAHYHNVCNVSEILADRGHHILLTARKKDILLDLIDYEQYQTIIVSTSGGSSGTFGLISSVLRREWKMLQIALRYKPDILIGTDIVITHIGKVLRVPSIILNEDDAKEVPLLARFGFKYASHVLSPQVCDISPYESKKVAYNSYHELAYLHPRYFGPNREQIADLFQDNERFFILRFSNLAAHHDDGRTGIDDEIAEQLIKQMKAYGKVYITSERALGVKLEPYRIMIHPTLMHQALSYATLYVGDSQTMAAEAAVLGTPSIRFNDFVGKLGYLEELEHRYGLTYGIPTSEPDRLYAKVEELLETPDLKKIWAVRRRRMLEEKIDLTAFLVWFIENYPQSVEQVRSNPSVMDQFRLQVSEYT